MTQIRLLACLATIGLGVPTASVWNIPGHKREFRDCDEDCLSGGRIGIPKGGAMDCTMVAAAPVLATGYVASASRITDRRVILAGYRLADLLMRVVGKVGMPTRDLFASFA